MDLVLGVSVMGDYGRMALVDATTGTVIDKYDVDLSAEAAETLVETIVNTDRGLTEDGHRLAGTRIAASDAVFGNDVRDEVAREGVANVTLVAPPDAAAAFVRTLATSAGEPTSALLFVAGNTATLSVVGVDEATTNLIAAEPVGEGAPTAALAQLLERLVRHPSDAQSIYLVGASDDLAELTDELTSPLPFRATDRTAYAVALGAAMAAAAMVAPVAERSATAVAATPAAPVELEAVEPEALEPEAAEPEDVEQTVAVPIVVAAAVPTGSWLVMPKSDAERAAITAAAEAAHAEAMKPKPKVKTKKAAKSKKVVKAPVEQPTVVVPVPTTEPETAEREAPAQRAPRMMLVGSSIAAAVAVIFVVLAAGVAIAIKPTASEQAVRDYESVPGKYLPVMPGQGSALVSDDGAYVPQVVRVSDKAPAGGSTSGPAGGGYPTVAQVGDRPVVAPTTDVPPAPLALPSGFPENLRDWLPTGMSGSLAELFPASADCTPGDSNCFLNTTGCQPGDVTCLNAMYLACQSGSPACKGTPIAQPHQAPASAPSVCPGPGDGCVRPESVLCPTPDDPACEPPPVVNPNEPLGVTPTPAAPPTEASEPPPPIPAPEATSEPPLPPAATEPAAPEGPVEPTTSEPPPVPHRGGLPGPR